MPDFESYGMPGTPFQGQSLPDYGQPGTPFQSYGSPGVPMQQIPFQYQGMGQDQNMDGNQYAVNRLSQMLKTYEELKRQRRKFNFDDNFDDEQY